MGWHLLQSFRHLLHCCLTLFALPPSCVERSRRPFDRVGRRKRDLSTELGVGKEIQRLQL